jgi:hypothetical protein
VCAHAPTVDEPAAVRRLLLAALGPFCLLAGAIA